MTPDQRKAVFAKLNKYPSPHQPQFRGAYSDLEKLARTGDIVAQKKLQRINESEGWTRGDIAEQIAFQKMLRGN